MSAARPAVLKIDYEVLIQAQRNSLLWIFSLRAPTHIPAHASTKTGKPPGKRAGLVSWFFDTSCASGSLGNRSGDDEWKAVLEWPPAATFGLRCSQAFDKPMQAVTFCLCRSQLAP